MVNTSTVLSASPSTSSLGAPVTLTAVVTAPQSVPVGAVSFYANTLALGSAILDTGGVATLQTAKIGLGTSSLTAVYGEGGGDFAGSTSPAITLTVTQSGKAIVLNNIIGDEYANSYADVAYADEYWTQHWDINSAAQWNALTADQKAALLVRSCRILEGLRFTEPVDSLAEFHLVYDTRNQQIRSAKTNFGRPQKYWIQQKLQFPRTLEVHMNGDIFVPEEILFAQCEQCVYLLNLDTSVLANRLQGVSHDMLSVGGVQFSQKIEAKGSLLSPISYSFCKPYILKTNLRIQRA